MALTISGNVSSGNLQDILAQAEEASSDERKDAKITRQLYHQKKMTMLDGNISKLKEQSSQLGKAGWLSFFTGIVAQGLQFLDLLVPGLGTVLSTAVNQTQSLNPFAKNAREAGVDAENYKKKAEKEDYRFAMEDERIKAMVESDQIFKNRMEKAIENVQKSQEAAVRV